MPATHFGKGKLHFHVILHPASDALPDWRQANQLRTVPEWLEQKPFPENNVLENGEEKTLRQTIQEEVSSEYDQVADYARNHLGLLVTYWWKEDWISEPRGNPFYTPKGAGCGQE